MKVVLATKYFLCITQERVKGEGSFGSFSTTQYSLSGGCFANSEAVIHDTETHFCEWVTEANSDAGQTPVKVYEVMREILSPSQ